ncbi:MAG: DUF4954 family protein [Muribaculaceae bacterium]|nr:DUF4954 family protein [Muribaculaceae bacterium]
MDQNEINILKANGCFAEDWDKVHIHPDSDLSLIRNVEFEGEVEVGVLDRKRYPRCMICNSLLADSKIGDGARLRYIAGGLHNAIVGERVEIENCASISFTADSRCGVGTHVAVLDETGSREVIIYPGLSSQMAMLMARCRKSDAARIREDISARIENGNLQVAPSIGARSVIRNCGPLRDISVGHDVIIDSARCLTEGAFINNLPEGTPAYMAGPGCDASGFIVEDGLIDSGTLLRNCYVGQGARLEKGFTAHDSLFFANCSMENGEACALFAGPYSVSMHKGSLLIGCQTSFLNAGSNTNESNHMYKLGPIHWGVLERGVKTSSGSYLMLGADIGAFSLLMGAHKTHPDSREFPFSYLFGDPQGATVVVPGVMLRSCGLLRDEQKWPVRDRRKQHPGLPEFDKVICDVLNPVTVDAMINAIDTIRPLLSKPADDDRYHRYKGMKLSRASLERAIRLYHLGIMKYLSRFISDGELFPSINDKNFQISPQESQSIRWIDMAGLPMPRKILDEALQDEKDSEALAAIFETTFADYQPLQMDWILNRMPASLRLTNREILDGAAEYDRLVELDRTTYREALDAENAMLRL